MAKGISFELYPLNLLNIFKNIRVNRSSSLPSPVSSSTLNMILSQWDKATLFCNNFKLLTVIFSFAPEAIAL